MVASLLSEVWQGETQVVRQLHKLYTSQQFSQIMLTTLFRGMTESEHAQNIINVVKGT